MDLLIPGQEVLHCNNDVVSQESQDCNDDNEKNDASEEKEMEEQSDSENQSKENEHEVQDCDSKDSEHLEALNKNVESENECGESISKETDNEVQDCNSKDSKHSEEVCVLENENVEIESDCTILKSLLKENGDEVQDCNSKDSKHLEKVREAESENENGFLKSILTNGEDCKRTNKKKKMHDDTSDATNCLISSDSEDVTVIPDMPMLTDENEDSEQDGIVNSKPPTESDKEMPVLTENFYETRIANNESPSSEMYKDVPELTIDEREKQKEIYGPGCAAVQYTKIHCTACNKHIGSALDNDKDRFVHPLLKVLVCRNCLDFYTSGEFDKDEDGSELYCRWCGQGGKVLCCSDCCYVFCQKCIRHNFGKMRLEFIKNSEDWRCFVCDPSQMVSKRVECFTFFDYIKKEKERVIPLNDPELFTHDYTYCCQHRNLSPAPPVKRKSTKNKDKDATFDISKEFEKPKKRKVERIVWNTQEAEEEVICAPDLSLLMDDEEAPSPPKQFPPPEPPKTIQGFRIIQLPGVQPPNVMTTFPQTVSQPIVLNARLAQPPTALNLRPAAPNLRPMAPNLRPAAQNMQPQRFMAIQPRIGVPMQRVMAPVNTQNYGIRFANPNLVNPPCLPPGMDNSWFDTAVKVTAEAHAKLSYNISNLSMERTNAKTIEDLVKVHNKLQEMLSTSINSLIQVRRNLRTEFLNGLNKVKFSSAKKPASEDDNDVVFVRSNTTPPPLVPAAAAEQPRQYLKVRSVSQLCNVPSECITIPDEVTERLQKKIEEEKKLSENGDSNKENLPVPEEKENPTSAGETEKGPSAENCGENDEASSEIKRAMFESKIEKMVTDNMKYNFPDDISNGELMRMLSVRVYVKKKCASVAERSESAPNEIDSDRVYCVD